MNILVVDDEKLILSGIQNILQQSNLNFTTIETASTPKIALDKFKRLHPEIVITDIRMPEMSGLDFLRALKETNIPFKSIIVSSYDDFSFAKEGILLGIENYLIKPLNQEELIHSIRVTMQKIINERQTNQLWTKEEHNIFRDNFLRKMLHQEIVSDDYQDWEELLSPYEHWNGYEVAYLSFGDPVATLQKETLIHLLSEHLAFIDLVNLTSEELSILFDSQQVSKEILKDAIIKSGLWNNVFVTFGPKVDVIEEIHQSFQQAKKLQSYSLVYGFGNAIDEQDIEKKNQLSEELISLEELTDLIIAGNLANIRQKFLQIQEQITAVQSTPTDILNLTVRIGVMLNQIQQKLGLIETDGIDELRFLIEKISSEKTTQSIFTFLLEISTGIIQRIDTTDISYSPVIQQILTILNKDLSLHHSLKTLANDFNMNSAYLGQLFQKEIGMNFNQYGHQQRLRKAHEQILNSNRKVSDIAKELGYKDISYFYRLYKKDYGIAPNQVRSNKYQSQNRPDQFQISSRS